jgi:putative glutathione S-transferase
MKLMIEGVWRGDVEPSLELSSQRQIRAGLFRGWVSADGPTGFPAEPGRYHLYVSYACPFAHRVILARMLKRLEPVIGMSVLHPIWNTPEGWVFGDGPLATTDGAGHGFTRLHQVYAAAEPAYTGKVTVPVLWDRRTRRIVSNESADILDMLSTAFDQVGGDRRVDLAPEALRSEIDSLNAQLSTWLARGVYAVGGARNQAAYDRAVSDLFGLLDRLEARLSDGRRFLHGEPLTTSDVIAFTPLVRFDAVYNPLFRASRKRLIDYPRLSAWTRRVYDLPGIAETVRFDHILAHYHDGDWGVSCRRGIVPALPDVDFRSAA